MAENNFEYKGENFSISWNSKEQILFIETLGVHDKKITEMFITKFREFYKRFAKPELVTKILVDSSKLIKTNHEARRIYTKQVKTFLGAAKIAICGANTVIRVVSNFLLGTVIKRKNIKVKFFTTTNEGLKWLKEI